MDLPWHFWFEACTRCSPMSRCSYFSTCRKKQQHTSSLLVFHMILQTIRCKSRKGFTEQSVVFHLTVRVLPVVRQQSRLNVCVRKHNDVLFKDTRRKHKVRSQSANGLPKLYSNYDYWWINQLHDSVWPEHIDPLQSSADCRDSALYFCSGRRFQWERSNSGGSYAAVTSSIGSRRRGVRLKSSVRPCWRSSV